jgi:hypothetical protein
VRMMVNVFLMNHDDDDEELFHILNQNDDDDQQEIMSIFLMMKVHLSEIYKIKRILEI